MLWTKALHIIFMVTWFCGLFYLPRLFVYHAEANDALSRERFQVMERKLYYMIMSPGALLTLFSGAWLIHYSPRSYLPMPWLHIKLSLVLFLIIYHLYLGRVLKAFRLGPNPHSSVFYRWLNEVPALFLIAIVILVVVKPF